MVQRSVVAPCVRNKVFIHNMVCTKIWRISSILSIVLLFSCTNGKYIKRSSSSDNHYDILIFSQIWPPTHCFEWKEHNSSRHCNLPGNEEWTIHGIWPTRNHTMGPFYCNRTLHFNLDSLNSIRSELNLKWIDIHKGTPPGEFWQHEWDKHGTCSVDIESMNTEKKYFQTGLKLLDIYDMKNELGKASILPGADYTAINILRAIRRVLGINGYVECITNPDTKESYLSEIRICFDKELKLKDCDNIPGFPTNCNSDKLVTYPSLVPNIAHNPVVIQI